MTSDDPENSEFDEPKTSIEHGGRQEPDALDAGLAAAFASSVDHGDLVEAEAEPDLIGQLINNRFRLISKIGQGGMGTVWLAEQIEPVRRQVALKLVRHGRDSRLVLSRFEAERQALAILDHPNIAKVFDGGVTEFGLPFFVMELIRGTPITKYCDARKLSLPKRLELFADVCSAVQHAHQKGIIHRDIKPANVLVEDIDQRAVPKVIDFGVAKAIGFSLTEFEADTGWGMIVGTLEYMSPEQASQESSDIDTRTDIYSLGALLYELLAGVPPFRSSELARAGMWEMLRLIRESEPPRPSWKLSSSNSQASTAANRNTNSQGLVQMLRNDLDWIVMKAIEKDRNRRYETAASLGDDVRRYLANLPVTARPPSQWYQVKKFIRRNRGFVAAAGAVLAALVLGTVVSVYFAWKANESRRASDWSEQRALTREVEARQNLALAMEAVDRFCDQVADDPRLAQHDLQSLRRELLQKAVEFQESLLQSRGHSSDAELDIAHSQIRLARISLLTGDREKANDYFSKGIEKLRSLVAKQPLVTALHAELAIEQSRFGNLLQSSGVPDAAEKFLRDGVAEANKLQADPAPTPDANHDAKRAVIQTNHLLANFLIGHRPEVDFTQRLGEAESLLLTAAKLQTELVESDSNDRDAAILLAQIEMQIARIYLHGLNIRRFRETSPHLEHAKILLESKTATDVNGSTHDNLVQVLAMQARVRRLENNLLESEQGLKQAIQLATENSLRFPSVIGYRSRLGGLLNEFALLFALQKKWVDVKPAALESIDVWKIVLGLDPKNSVAIGGLGEAWGNLALAERNLELLPEALEHIGKSIELAESVIGGGSEWSRGSLGAAYELRSVWLFDDGKLDRALSDLERATELTSTNVLIQPKLRSYRARTIAAQGNWQSAESEIRQLVESMPQERTMGYGIPLLVAAEAMSIAATKAEISAELLPADQKTKAEELKKYAVELISLATQCGVRDTVFLDSRKNFDSLRLRADYKAAIESLAPQK